MPNHQVPIEEADLWDVIDWDVTAKLSQDVGSGPHENPQAWAAKCLIEAESSADQLDLFHRISTNYIGSGAPFVRHQRAAALAMLFGADPLRLMAFLGRKWGLFKQRDRVKS